MNHLCFYDWKCNRLQKDFRNWQLLPPSFFVMDGFSSIQGRLENMVEMLHGSLDFVSQLVLYLVGRFSGRPCRINHINILLFYVFESLS